MRRHPPKPIRLKRADRQELQRLIGDGPTEQRVARSCHVRLALEDPHTISESLNQAELRLKSLMV